MAAQWQAFDGYRGYVGSASYQVHAEFQISQYGETQAYVQVKYSIHNLGGNIQVSFDTWWGKVGVYGGAGWYGDTGWQNIGWVDYGKGISRNVYASATLYSGKYTDSRVSCWYVPQAPVWKPKNVRNVHISSVSDSKIQLVWNNEITPARPYQAIWVDRSVDGGAFILREKPSGAPTSYVDTDIEPNHTYQYRILPTNTTGDAPDFQYTSIAYTTPKAPTAASASRNDDSRATITFTPGSSNYNLYTGHQIERQVNGGAWSVLEAVTARTNSYVDSSTQPNCFYRYRVKSVNPSGVSPYTYTGIIYNTPSAPGKPNIGRTGANTMLATFENNARTATSLQVQRSTDKNTWTDVSTIAGTATSFTDSPGGGTFYYRIRNVRASLYSEWVESDAIVTIAPPNPPTITSPKPSEVINMTTPTLTVKWLHNPVDGSVQTAAELMYSVDGGSSWVTKSWTDDTSSLTIDNNFQLNTTLQFKARTKGQHADFSDWSTATVVSVRQAPSITIEEPAQDFVIKSVPINFRLAYDDASGELQSGSLSITEKDSGELVYMRDITESLEFITTEAEWVPKNKTTYTVNVYVRSSSTLQSGAIRDVTVDYVPPNTAAVSAEPDLKTGYIALTIREILSSERAAMKTAALWRNVNGKRKLLGADLHDGAQLVDKYAPLNETFTYETTSVAESGAVEEAAFEGRFDSDLFYIYYAGGIASAKYNAEEDIDITPESTTIVVAGRTYPIAVVSDRLQESHSISATVKNKTEALKLKAVAESSAPFIVKTLAGQVFHAVGTAKLTPTLNSTHEWSVSFSLTRIDGEEL